MKSRGQNTGKRNQPTRPPAPRLSPEQAGLEAAARVLAAGGRVPKKFAKARPASAGPTAGEAAAQVKITPARRVAFEILTLVEAGKGHSDELLHGVRTQALSEPDRHLATALVMGVLRWQIALDARVRRLLERPEQTLPPAVALILRLGAFQLLHMDRIPAHAALSESVEITRAAGQPFAAGMVNAVLRKLTRAEAPAVRQAETESVASFAERLGHPFWLVERWAGQYGREAARAICEADQQEPAAGGLFHADPELPQIDDGSRLVAELTAAALPKDLGRAARVWDCCAAPGGKTLVLAQRLNGAQILATDISAKRLAAMNLRLKRVPGAQALIRTAQTDAGALPSDEGEFDLILCDVPCSGTGTLGRNPEIRLNLDKTQLARQQARQRAILAAALQRLAPGGRLLYSTCSLEPEENEQVISEVGAAFPRIAVSDLLAGVSTLLAPVQDLIREDVLRTLPGVHPCDGFFAAVFERPA